MCFVQFAQQIATFALYNINRSAFITKVKTVHCAVRTGSCKENRLSFVLKELIW